MSDDIVQRLRRWDGGISTHWVGCFDSHPVCAIRFAADAIEARDAEIERLRRWKAEATEVIARWDAVADLVPARFGYRRSAAVAAEIETLRGIQRAVVALARSVLGESEHPVERSPWIDVIHMMDEEARTNGSASARANGSAGATHVGAQP